MQDYDNGFFSLRTIYSISRSIWEMGEKTRTIIASGQNKAR